MNIAQLEKEITKFVTQALAKVGHKDLTDDVLEFIHRNSDLDLDGFDDETLNTELDKSDVREIAGEAAQAAYGALAQELNLRSKRNEKVVEEVVDKLCRKYGYNPGNIDPSYYSSY